MGRKDQTHSNRKGKENVTTSLSLRERKKEKGGGRPFPLLTEGSVTMGRERRGEEQVSIPFQKRGKEEGGTLTPVASVGKAGRSIRRWKGEKGGGGDEGPSLFSFFLVGRKKEKERESPVMGGEREGSPVFLIPSSRKKKKGIISSVETESCGKPERKRRAFPSLVSVLKGKEKKRERKSLPVPLHRLGRPLGCETVGKREEV